MRSKIILLVFICIALILAACTEMRDVPVIPDHELSGELIVALSYNYDVAHKKSSEPKVITDRTSYLPIHQKILRFTEKHPRVTIKVLDAEWETRYDRGVGHREMSPPNFIIHKPDIIELTPHQVRWMMDGELQELSFYYENYPMENSWPEDYSYLNELTMVDGGKYLLPVTTDPMIVFYSAQTFELLGIDRPEDDWSWDDFLGIARRVNDAGYINGVFWTKAYSESKASVDNIEHFIVAHGGRFISSDQTEFSGYLDSEHTRQAFELYLDVFEPLFETDYRWDSKVSSSIRTHLPTFGMGRASKLFTVLDVIDPYEKDPTNNRGYELLPMPRADDGRAYNTSFVTGLAMTEQSQHKELAWEFMKFIASDDDLMRLVAENTLATEEGRFITRQPEQYDNLIELMRIETLNSMASSMFFVPHFVSSSIYDEAGDFNPDNVRWGLDQEEPLPMQIERIRNGVEEMRDEMIEHGIRVPWWGEYGLSF